MEDKSPCPWHTLHTSQLQLSPSHQASGCDPRLIAPAYSLRPNVPGACAIVWQSRRCWPAYRWTHGWRWVESQDTRANLCKMQSRLGVSASGKSGFFIQSWVLMWWYSVRFGTLYVSLWDCAGFVRIACYSALPFFVTWNPTNLNFQLLQKVVSLLRTSQPIMILALGKEQAERPVRETRNQPELVFQ